MLTDGIRAVCACDVLAVPVGVPSVELSIANTSLVVRWSMLPHELARGRITGYQVLLRPTHNSEQPLIATVENARQHVIDGTALKV